MSKVVSYDNIVEGGGTMRLDDDNNPIVVEGLKLTRADKFKAAMEEDIHSHTNYQYNDKGEEVPILNVIRKTYPFIEMDSYEMLLENVINGNLDVAILHSVVFTHFETNMSSFSN